ncbi:MAG: CHASE2 domain-containing protein [Granulosicoccaceae bacterium]
MAAKSRPSGITPLWLLGFLVLLLSLTGVLLWSDATHKLDRLLHDSWVRFNQRVPHENVVIAAIDPTSLRQLGRWPWPRNVQSLLYNRIADLDAAAVVADVLYTEPDDNSSVDQLLVDSLARQKIAILPVFTEGTQGQNGAEKLPLPALTQLVTDLGHIHLPIDDDGIVRRVYLKAGYNNPHWSSLPLAAYLQSVPADDRATLEIPGKRVPDKGESQFKWVQDYEVLIPFYGPSGTIPSVSAISLINGQADPESIRGKTVFVGITGTGLGDIVPTPVSALDQPVPGVEIHANIYSALLDNSLVIRVDYWLNFVVALLLLPLMLLVYSRAATRWGLAMALFGALLPIALSYVMYYFGKLWYPPLSASLPILVSYLLWSWNRLSYVSLFLAQENAHLVPALQAGDRADNGALEAFFKHAAMHLPIKSWKFSARGQLVEGGGSIPDLPDNANAVNWLKHNNYYKKNYPTPGKLSISLEVEDETVGIQLTRYIDSLARVQLRRKPGRFTGSIEKLQNSALKLSDQMATLRGIKVFAETVLAGSPAGFIVWNAAGEMVRSNPLIRELLPRLRAAPLLIDFIKELDRDPSQGRDRKLLRALMLESKSWQVIKIDGEREFIVNFSAVGEQLSERLICASVVDVSDIRGAERARAEMVDYLSHDLRSPLVSAMYGLEEIDEDQNEQTERIRSNINRSLQMMDDLLHVARADTLRADSFSEVLFNSVVDNALDQLLPQARKRKISIEIDTEDDDLWLLGDASSLERAVVNIIGNAIKYSEDAGKIHIKTFRQDSSVLLHVIDDGVGIDPTIIGDVFTRFKRDAKVADKFQGIGLGLALVSRVVSQHRGFVHAESPGKGTKIVLKLPLQVEALTD